MVPKKIGQGFLGLIGEEQKSAASGCKRCYNGNRIQTYVNQP